MATSYEFEDVAARCGWTPVTQVCVLLDFISSTVLDSSLESFLRKREDEENSLYEEEDEEEEEDVGYET